MLKVLLIYPPTQLINREDRCQVPSKHVAIAPPLPPTDLMYMAAVTERQKAVAKIVDYTLDNKSIEDLRADLKAFHPDYLVISTTTPTLEEDLDICETVKIILPDAQIIAKAAHFLKFSREILEKYPHLDMVVRGEAEFALEEIIGGKDRSQIQGLAYRDGNSIKHNPDRVYPDNLDELPFPARHLVDNRRYVRPDNSKPQAIIKVARGCPFDCFFCLATAVSGKKVRVRSPQNIIAEVKECIDKYKIKDFLFWSDTFNMKKNWVKELCNSIIDEGLQFNWASNTRVDAIDIESAKLMRKANCKLVSVGIESGNQDILDKMGKNITIEQIREAFRIFKKAKLKTFAYYMIGLPWETRETIEDTINLAIELDSDYVNIFTATPLPGSRFFDYALENNLFEPNDNITFQNAYSYPIVRGHYLSNDEISGFWNMALKRIYFRPRYIIKTALGIRSFTEFYNHAKAALILAKDRML